jgi:hypothetical protein
MLPDGERVQLRASCATPADASTVDPRVPLPHARNTLTVLA